MMILFAGLNSDERGEFIGAFKGDDKILSILSTGELKLTSYDLSTHFDDNMIKVSMFDPDSIFTAVYYDGEQKKYYVKRFQLPENTSVNKLLNFISEEKGTKLITFSLDYLPRLQFDIKKDGSNQTEVEVIPLADFIAVKGYRAKGKRLSKHNLRKIKFIKPLPYTPPEKEVEEVILSEDIEAEVANIESSVETKHEPEVEKVVAKKDKPKASEKKKKEDKPPVIDTNEPPQLELDF